MAENFHDAKKVKTKRASNFMGSVKEITKVPKPAPVKVPEPLVQVKEKPPETQETPVTTEPVDEKEKVHLEKGYVVGYTKEGIVKLQPFGGIGELELIALVEYSKVKSKELLHRIAKTGNSYLPSIKQGVVVLAEGIQSLLKKQEDLEAAS